MHDPDARVSVQPPRGASSISNHTFVPSKIRHDAFKLLDLEADGPHSPLAPVALVLKSLFKPRHFVCGGALCSVRFAPRYVTWN